MVQLVSRRKDVTEMQIFAMFQTQVQLYQINAIPLWSKSYVNEVTLREQKWPLKYCQPLDFLYTSLKGLDLLIL